MAAQVPQAVGVQATEDQPRTALETQESDASLELRGCDAHAVAWVYPRPRPVEVEAGLRPEGLCKAVEVGSLLWIDIV